MTCVQTAKICPSCKEEKLLTEFYTHRGRADGHQSYCKCCMNFYAKTEAGKLVQKKYDNSPKGKLTKKVYRGSPVGKLVQETYRKSSKGEFARKKYRKSEKGKLGTKKYRNSLKGKLANKKYANSPKGKLTRKEHYKTPEGKAQAKQSYHLYCARKLNATIGPVDIQGVYDRCNNCCTYCGTTENLSLDHIVALSVGGPHTDDNLTIACGSCNSSKGAKPVDEWLASRQKSL